MWKEKYVYIVNIEQQPNESMLGTDMKSASGLSFEYKNLHMNSLINLTRKKE